MTAAEVRAGLVDSRARLATPGRKVRKDRRVLRVSPASRVRRGRGVHRDLLVSPGLPELHKALRALPDHRAFKAAPASRALKAQAAVDRVRKALPVSRARRVLREPLARKALPVPRARKVTKGARVSPARLAPAEARGCLVRRGRLA